METYLLAGWLIITQHTLQVSYINMWPHRCSNTLTINLWSAWFSSATLTPCSPARIRYPCSTNWISGGSSPGRLSKLPMLRRNSRLYEDSRIFSSIENCWRIPENDKALEAFVYWQWNEETEWWTKNNSNVEEIYDFNQIVQYTILVTQKFHLVLN